MIHKAKNLSPHQKAAIDNTGIKIPSTSHSRLTAIPVLGMLRFCGYKVVSHLPGEWLRWLRSRNAPKEILERFAINCVFDVGANRGQFGTLLRQLGYAGWILSFEPVSENLDALKAVAAAAQPWRVFPYALGSTDVYKTINITLNTVFSSFLVPDEESQTRFPGNSVARTQDVEMRRLDTVFDACTKGIPSPRIYLKLDTQGFDVEVARGAETTLSEILALQTEVTFRPIYSGMAGFAESIHYFQTRGFQVVDFTPVTRDTDDLCAVEMDCLMVRKLRSDS